MQCWFRLASIALVAEVTIALTGVSLRGTPEAGLAIAAPNMALKQIDVEQNYLVDLGRAKNLARMRAETINGGLGQYRAERAMHGPAFEAPVTDNGDGSFTFIIYGGEPGFATPSIESVILVRPDTGIIDVEYNGPIREFRNLSDRRNLPIAESTQADK